MRLSRTAALIPLACLAIGGCRLGNPLAKAPTGQVVATVNGEEITARDLQAEMGGATYPDAATRQKAQQAAIGAIIERKILADEARKQGLDKTPDFALQKQRAIDSLMMQTLIQKVVASVPPPSSDEVQRFITDNPDVFAQRKIFTLDQLIFPRPSDEAVFDEIKPMSTLEQVKAALDARHIPNRTRTIDFDSVGPDVDVRMAATFANLKPTDLAMLESGNEFAVNHVVSARIVPLSGEPAVQYATAYLRRQHARDAAREEATQLLAAAKPHVAINKAYRKSPPPPRAAAPSATPSGAGKGA